MSKEDYDKLIGNNVRNVRLSFGYSELYVSNWVGVPVETIKLYENGDLRIPLDTLEKFALLFDMDAYDFYTDDATRNIKNISTTVCYTNSSEDMSTILQFKQIVQNYLRMIKLKKQQNNG